MIVELILSALFVLFGAVSAFRSLSAVGDGASRFLVAVHDAAKALFWLSLGGFFLAYGLAEEPQSVRWLALVPIAMAALRLIAAAVLARR